MNSHIFAHALNVFNVVEINADNFVFGLDKQEVLGCLYVQCIATFGVNPVFGFVYCLF